MVPWISYEMNIMYSTNVDRNKVIYELWERKLTVEQISSSTNIPRSTVGYYVRKFNRLAAQGKPVVFQGLNQSVREQDPTDDMARELLRVMIIKEARVDDWKVLYLRLKVVKLLKELGLFTEKNWGAMLGALAENLQLRERWRREEIETS